MDMVGLNFEKGLDDISPMLAGWQWHHVKRTKCKFIKLLTTEAFYEKKSKRVERLGVGSNGSRSKYLFTIY